MTKNATGQAAKGDVVMIVPPQAIVGRMDQIRAMIAKRAYEFYERRGVTLMTGLKPKGRYFIRADTI
jgi:hypothetical protein